MTIKSDIQQLTPDANGNIKVEIDKLHGGIFDVELTTDGQNVAIVSTTNFYRASDGINGRVIDPTGNAGERSMRVTSLPNVPRSDVFYITMINPTANARMYVLYSYSQP